MGSISTGENADEVEKILCNAGYQTISVKGREVRIGWRHLSKEDLQTIRQTLKSNGYEVHSVCQASWLSRPIGLDIL